MADRNSNRSGIALCLPPTGTTSNLPDFRVRAHGLDLDLCARFTETGIEGYGLMLVITAADADAIGLKLCGGEPAIIGERLKAAGYDIPTTTDGAPSGPSCPVAVGVGANVGIWLDEDGWMANGTVIEATPNACVVRLDPDEGGKVIAATWNQVWAKNCGPALTPSPAA